MYIINNNTIIIILKSYNQINLITTNIHANDILNYILYM